MTFYYNVLLWRFTKTFYYNVLLRRFIGTFYDEARLCKNFTKEKLVSTLYIEYVLSNQVIFLWFVLKRRSLLLSLEYLLLKWNEKKSII